MFKDPLTSPPLITLAHGSALSKGGHVSSTCWGWQDSCKFKWNSNTLEYIMPAEVTVKVKSCQTVIAPLIIYHLIRKVKQGRHTFIDTYMQPSGSFYSSCSQRTIFSLVSYVYFMKQNKRQNTVAWAGGGVERDKGQRQG